MMTSFVFLCLFHLVMMMSRLTIFTVSFAVLVLSINADDSCLFETSKGVIDLTSLGRTDGKAVYPDIVPSLPLLIYII
jgi:hypothetical protein